MNRDGMRAARPGDDRIAVRARAHATATAFALAMATACSTPAPAPAPPPAPAPRQSYVVLLPGEDGRTGAITVTDARGTAVLDRPHQALRLDTSTDARFDAAPEDVERTFGTAREALPRPPEVFRVYFETNAAALAPPSQRMIEEILAEVARRPGADVSIVGHTDTVGDAAANERLGRERAEWIARLLRARGLASASVAVSSHGETDPLVRTPDNTEEVRNRRVEVIVR